MSEVASRWALVASLALHAGVIALGLLTPRPRLAPAWFTDFWGGKTFEVPDLPSDQGEGETPSDEDESVNEINVEGVDTSADTKAPTPSSPADDGPAKERPPARPRAPARASSQSSTAPAASHGSGPGGTFGAENAVVGVRDLFRSFVRAAPLIATSDPAWSSLPLGPAGSADVTLILDDEGKPHVAGGVAAPVHLRRLVQKTVSIMSGGRFGVESGDGVASQQKMHIALTLTQRATPSQDQAALGGAYGLGFESSDDQKSMHAFFTLASGRHVDIAVRKLSR